MLEPMESCEKTSDNNRQVRLFMKLVNKYTKQTGVLNAIYMALEDVSDKRGGEKK